MGIVSEPRFTQSKHFYDFQMYSTVLRKKASIIVQDPLRGFYKEAILDKFDN